MSRKYTITLNEEQLMLISNCVEDIHRFLCGQMEMSNTTSVLTRYKPVRDILKDIKPFVAPCLWAGQSYDWSGNGCHNKYQREMIARTYYLYREMLHQYNLANNYQNVYSSPTLRCEDSGEPIKITWEE